MTRLLMLILVFPLASLAQLQLYLFDGTNETPIGVSYDIGTAAPGDTIETRFRVRNLSTSAITIAQISVPGPQFRIDAAPSLPYILAPGAPADFRTGFSTAKSGAYSAVLAVNNLTVSLSATVAPAPALYLARSSTPLPGGATIDFGSTLRGTSQSQGFVLKNNGATSLKVGSISVAGTAFRGPIGLTAPVQLAPGASIPFQVAFEPPAGQPQQGTLTIDQRTFHLTGLGLDPPLPAASITFDSRTPLSAQQLHVSVALASASEVSGTGTLTLEFHPSVSGVSDDPAIQFLSGPPRIASLTIAPGDTSASFYGQADLAFQTGTTAGDITFILTLPNGTHQASLTVTPAAIDISSATAVRRVGDLDVSIVGLDNTYSASALAFTFFDTTGKMIQPGTILADETSAFHTYFTGGQNGGAFALRATFPVTGDVSQVAAVKVQMTNSAGTIETQQIPFN
jgi:centrosomal CEP192-like protein